jgi:hypothetical protein
MCDLKTYLSNALGGNQKVGDCTNPYKVNTGWNFPAVVCKLHWDLAGLLMETPPATLIPLIQNGVLTNPGGYAPAHNIPQNYKDDYCRLLCLMQNTTAVLECLRRLNVELANSVQYRKKHKDDLDDRFHSVKKVNREYVRLSRALSNYECYCMFPSNHVIFAGALSAAEFVWGLQQGFMPKDPGAGSNHGDFSHRLQWHAVLRTITNNFSTPKFGAWNYSPLQLFTSLGSPAAAARNIWGTIFDAQGRPNYSDPSNLMRDVISEIKGPLQARIEKSQVKRADLERACNQSLQQTINGLPPAIKDFLGELNSPYYTRLGVQAPIAANMFTAVYRWKKLGQAAAPANFDPNVAPAAFPAGSRMAGYAKLVAGAQLTAWSNYCNDLTTYAAFQFWNRYINDQGDKIGKFLRGSRPKDYVNETMNGNLVDAILVADDDDRLINVAIGQRCISSATSFSMFYQYSEKFGCLRV